MKSDEVGQLKYVSLFEKWTGMTIEFRECYCSNGTFLLYICKVSITPYYYSINEKRIYQGII